MSDNNKMRLCNGNMKNFPFKLQNASHRRPIDHNYPYYDDPKKNFGKRFQVMYVLYDGYETTYSCEAICDTVCDDYDFLKGRIFFA